MLIQNCPGITTTSSNLLTTSPTTTTRSSTGQNLNQTSTRLNSASTSQINFLNSLKPSRLCLVQLNTWYQTTSRWQTSPWYPLSWLKCTTQSSNIAISYRLWSINTQNQRLTSRRCWMSSRTGLFLATIDSSRLRSQPLPTGTSEGSRLHSDTNLCTKELILRWKGLLLVKPHIGPKKRRFFQWTSQICRISLMAISNYLKRMLFMSILRINGCQALTELLHRKKL